MIEFKNHNYQRIWTDDQHCYIINAKGGTRVRIDDLEGVVMCYGHWGDESESAKPQDGESLERCAHRILTYNGWESPWRTVEE